MSRRRSSPGRPTGGRRRPRSRPVLIDAGVDSIGDALTGADLVVLAAPPLACLDLLEAVAALRAVLAPGAVVTDVASTKTAIVERAAGLGLPFVGGHPMAGVTDRGFEASDGTLFHDRPWVICEGPTSPAGGYERVAALARACGARPVGDVPGRARSSGRLDQPPASRPRGRSRGDGRRPDRSGRRGRIAGRCPGRLAGGPRPRCGRLGLVDPPRSRRCRHGDRDRDHERRPSSPNGSASSRRRSHPGAGRSRPATRRGSPPDSRTPGDASSTTARPDDLHGRGAESVLVIPRERVPPPPWTGLRRDEAAIGELLATIAAEARFEPRARMEADPRFKQVIPYLILRDGPRWFLMRRTRAGGDARLHDRWSIGVGGHVNPGDGDVLGGLRREWAEELEADFVPDFVRGRPARRRRDRRRIRPSRDRLPRRGSRASGRDP